MVGNAVPPRLAWFVAIQMKKTFAKEMNETIFEIRDEAVKKISVKEIAKRYRGPIIRNVPLSELVKDELDLTKNVLISLVKSDTADCYINQSARIYYTGKKFPSAIDHNKLYYFMPYLKGKGIRDLYYIKLVRTGTKREVHPECDDNDLRLVFEIEFVKQLFSGYKPIHLNIWRTFTDTTAGRILKMTMEDE